VLTSISGVLSGKENGVDAAMEKLRSAMATPAEA
jgi:hypothetical protein